jgi:hypothetical protein
VEFENSFSQANALDEKIEDARAAAEIHTWCFTFGVGSPLKNYYVQIDAETELQARLRMNALFTQHWGSCYPLAGFERQIADYGYERLNVYTEASVRLRTNPDDLEPAQMRACYPWVQTT